MFGHAGRKSMLDIQNNYLTNQSPCHKIAILCLCLTITTFHIGYVYSGTNNEEEIESSAHIPFQNGDRKNKAFISEGEFLKYKVGYWIFENVGVATFKCERNNDNLVVTIDAFTTGLLDKIIHRHNIYKTTMKIEEETGRLIPISSYEKKIRGDNERVTITNYDYVNNIREYKIWKNGEIRKENSVKIDPNILDDSISVAYNFRNEIYGKVVDSASLKLSAVRKDKTSVFKFDVHSADNSVEYSRWNEIANIKYVVEIAINPEVIDSKKGKLIVLYMENLVPVGFIAKDIIGFGDLYGFLIKDTN